MQKINLRELYPDVYKTDVFVDVAEEVVAAIRGQEQDDAAYERRKFRHKAHYSLNREDGIENDALNRPLTPEEILEQKQLREEVYAALMQLTAVQARRIYARFYLGMTVAEIARIEGADRRRVWESIRRGLKKLARLLDTICGDFTFPDVQRFRFVFVGKAEIVKFHLLTGLGQCFRRQQIFKNKGTQPQLGSLLLRQALKLRCGVIFFHLSAGNIDKTIRKTAQIVEPML